MPKASPPGGSMPCRTLRPRLTDSRLRARTATPLQVVCRHGIQSASPPPEGDELAQKTPAKAGGNKGTTDYSAAVVAAASVAGAASTAGAVSAAGAVSTVASASAGAVLLSVVSTVLLSSLAQPLKKIAPRTAQKRATFFIISTSSHQMVCSNGVPTVHADRKLKCAVYEKLKYAHRWLLPG